MDIRLDVEFFTHPKTIKLERRLGLEGVKSLLQLWMWAAKNRPQGVLHNMNEEDIEIAAGWGGEEGDFFRVLSELRWVDCEGQVCILHNWGERNGWVAASVARGDRARFSRLAATCPALYDKLVAQGKDAITRSEYQRLTAEYAASTTVNDSSTTVASVNNKSSTTVNAASTPPPNPPPSPNPDIKEESHTNGDLSTRLSTEISTSPEAMEALKVYRSFPYCRFRTEEQDLQWIVSLYQKFQIDVYKEMKDAKKWADSKGFVVKDPKAFLLNWFKKLQKLQTENVRN